MRALVRDTTAPAATSLETAGAELQRGVFDDPSSLPAALEGAPALFAVPPVALGPAGSDVELESARGRQLYAGWTSRKSAARCCEALDA